MVDRAKGQMRLVNAIVRLHETGYEISLALVGSGMDEQKIKEEIIKEMPHPIFLCVEIR